MMVFWRMPPVRVLAAVASDGASSRLPRKCAYLHNVLVGACTRKSEEQCLQFFTVLAWDHLRFFRWVVAWGHFQFFTALTAGALVVGGLAGKPTACCCSARVEIVNATHAATFVDELKDVQSGQPYGDSSPAPLQRRHQIGKGVSSVVFEGVLSGGGKCAIKRMRKDCDVKMQREIRVLEHLRGGPNIVELLDVGHDPESNTPCLVLEYVENTHPKKLYPTFTDSDVRFYMYELLKALEFCHSQGIIHRDVKPRNIVFDHANKKLRLVDWGLAEFHKPGHDKSLRVSSLHYKAPELLVGFRQYDYALDTWSVGCVLAGLVFKKEPFFAGHDEKEQLYKISRVLGTSELFVYLNKYGLDPTVEASCPRHARRQWTQFISLENRHLATPDALDLIDRMLVYDHEYRISAKDAMQHPYFASVREIEGTLVPIAFKPGKLGITAEPNGLVTKVVPGSQADRAGIVAGCHLEEVQGVKFTVSLLKSYLTGDQNYTITFRREDLETPTCT